MFEYLLVHHCAPTLAGLKMANLFTYNKQDVYEKIFSLNERLNIFDIYIDIIGQIDEKYLIYVYRKNILQERLQDENIRNFLFNYGYDFECSYILDILKERINKYEFPHEIGIFLGYPLDDVQMFIKNKGKNYKLSGTWKVYSDEETSAKIFDSYKKCTSRLLDMFESGSSIVRLCA